MQPIDRVEKAGWAPSAIAPHYQSMATAWSDLLAAYSDQQLALFLDLSAACTSCPSNSSPA